MGSRRGRPQQQQQQHPPPPPPPAGAGAVEGPRPGGPARGGGRGHGGPFPQQQQAPQGGGRGNPAAPPQQPRDDAGAGRGRGRGARGAATRPQQHPGGDGRGAAHGAGTSSAPAAGPLGRLAPELRQAMEEPSPPPPQAAPPAQAVPAQAEAAATGQATIPASSKAIRFPLRPGKGSAGTRCLVKANHFIAQLPDKDLQHYDVSITPEVTSRVVSRAVINELVSLHRAAYLGGRLPAYDGRKSLYTAGPLPFTSKEFQITLLDDDDGTGAQRNFKVAIKFAARADLHRLGMFLAGRNAEAP